MNDNKTKKKPSEAEEGKQQEKPSIKSEILEWVQVIAIACVIAVLINTFIIANSKVPTGSMENTIMSGERLIGFRISYVFGEPERGDIVIFRYPLNEKVYYIKRLIGLPGDTVDIVNGKVYLNGSDEALNEPYLKEPMEAEQPMHFEVPEDCYFFMGDNRNNSLDARYWEAMAMRTPGADPDRDYSFVTRDELVAKAIFSYFPHFSILTQKYDY